MRLRFVRTGMNVTVRATHRLNELAAKSQPPRPRETSALALATRRPIAVWESPDAIEAAGEKVRAYYQSIGFDMPAMLVRWGVKAALGYYRAPSLLQ